MATASTSSSRTILDQDPDKRIVEGDDVGWSINLDNLKIPNLNQCDSFDFLNNDILSNDNVNANFQ